MGEGAALGRAQLSSAAADTAAVPSNFAVVLKYGGKRVLHRGDGDSWCKPDDVDINKKKRMRKSDFDKKADELQRVNEQLSESKRRVCQQEVELSTIKLEQHAARQVNSFSTHRVSSITSSFDAAAASASHPYTKSINAGRDLLLRSVTEQAARQRMRPSDLKDMSALKRDNKALRENNDVLCDRIKYKDMQIATEDQKKTAEREASRAKASQLRADKEILQRRAQARAHSHSTASKIDGIVH